MSFAFNFDTRDDLEKLQPFTQNIGQSTVYAIENTALEASAKSFSNKQ